MSVETDDWEMQQAAFASLGDGLPLVPPTPQRIASMLEANGVKGDERVALLAPALGEATWRALAENAVLAGCRPEYLRVLGAAVAAVADDAFNLLGIQTTTGAAAPLIIVNGPVAARIGMNAGGNALGPGNRANASLGRALRLVLQNIGGARPGEMDMATLGHPGKYTFCLAENEAESPWPPLHAGFGCAASDSAVTVVAASGFIEVVDSVSRKPEDLARTYASSMVYAGSVSLTGHIGSGQPLIVMPPEHAQHFQRAGWSREKVQAALLEDAALPMDRLSPAVRERIAAHRKGDASSPIRIAERPEDILIVVAGGTGVKAAYIPTWGGSRAVTRRV
jgi:hypothetical protein